MRRAGQYVAFKALCEGGEAVGQRRQAHLRACACLALEQMSTPEAQAVNPLLHAADTLQMPRLEIQVNEKKHFFQLVKKSSV